MEIVKATADMLKSFYGHPMKRSCVAYAAIEDGVVHAVSGYYTDSHHRVLFSEITDEMRSHPVLLFKTAKKIVKEAGSGNLQLYAVADQCVDASERFLERLGFVQVSKEVWQCQA